MTDIAIRAEHLGKLYYIGPRERYRTLRDSLTDAMYGPFRALGSLLPGRRSAVDGQPSSVVGPPSSVLSPSSVSGPRSSVLGRPDTIWALRDVSFEVKHGEVVGSIRHSVADRPP